MAQASRSASSTSLSSDDPIENVGHWLKSNSQTIALALGGAALLAVSAFGYRAYTSGQNTKASTALYAAQEPVSQGNLDEAAKALQKVSQNFGGTSSGQQASLLLAQVLYEQKKYPEGVAALEKAVASASVDFKAPMESLIAVGFEFQGKLIEAAEHYGKAASVAKFANDKVTYQTAQARSLTNGGKVAEAKALWEELAKGSAQASQEAQVRLGEIEGSGKK